MNSTLALAKARAAYRAERQKQLSARRKARLDAQREKFIRRYVTERAGWQFAGLAMAAAFVVALIKIT